MQVPDSIRKCVFFVGCRLADGTYHLGGTAFFVGRPMPKVPGTPFVYVVTARHVIDKIRSLGIRTVSLRLNFKDGGARWLDYDVARWRFHPDPSVDVAVMRVDADVEDDHLNFPIYAIATDAVIAAEGIGIGNEVFLAGLFIRHAGKQRNIPILRVGNIAAMPEEPIEADFGPNNLIEGYLIEARSFGGLSGSPVFTHFDDMKVRLQSYYLLGLIHGHYDIPSFSSDGSDEFDLFDLSIEDASAKSVVNTGIAIVVPASKILEVLDQPIIREEENQVEQETLRKGLPTLDNLNSDQELDISENGQGLTRE
jgi:hypothetical protein